MGESGHRARSDLQVPGVLPPVLRCRRLDGNEGTGTAGDDHPLADIRLGERFIADAYQLIPDYRQLGFRVPGLVITNLAQPHRVVHEGPFEHSSSLALIESTFGLNPLTTRDRHARNIADILLPGPVPSHRAVKPFAIPASSDVIGPAISPPSESLLEVLTARPLSLSGRGGRAAGSSTAGAGANGARAGVTHGPGLPGAAHNRGFHCGQGGGARTRRLPPAGP